MRDIAWQVVVGIFVMVWQVSVLSILAPQGRVASFVFVLTAWMVLHFDWRFTWWRIFLLALLVDIVVDQQVGASLYYTLVLAGVTTLVSMQMSFASEFKRGMVTVLLVSIFQGLLLVSEQTFTFSKIWSIALSAVLMYGMLVFCWNLWQTWQQKRGRITPKLHS